VLVQCPFRFFIERILHILPADADESLVSATEFGNLIHDILSDFYRSWIHDQGVPPDASTVDEARDLLRECAQDHLSRLRGISPFVKRFYQVRLFGASESAKADQPPSALQLLKDGILNCFLDCEVARSSRMKGNGFIPAHFEAGFGMEGDEQIFSIKDPLDIETPHGHVKLKGRIDRIDHFENAFAVIDYKTGHVPSRKSIADGTSIQLPVYMLAASAIYRMQGQPHIAAGGLYMTIRQNKTQMLGYALREDFAEPMGITKHSIVKEADFYPMLEQTEAQLGEAKLRLQNGEFHITVKDETKTCQFCSYSDVCRKNVSRMAQILPPVMADV